MALWDVWEEAFQEIGETKLERWWRSLGWEPVDEQPDERPRWRLVNRHGEPVRCRLCGYDDRWVFEGDPNRPRPWNAYVCLHGYVDLPRGRLRKLDSVNVRDVAIAERA